MSDHSLPKGAKGIAGADKTVAWKSSQPKYVNTEVYWRCPCGGGAPLETWKCEKCGKAPQK